jgi:hypothetical protein
MPTGGNLSGVNLGRAETLLQRPEIAQGAFDGQAKGLQALAGGIAEAGKDISTAVTHIQEQRDNNQVWKATDTLNQAYNAVSADIAANPTKPEEYGPKMQKGLDDAYQQIASDQDLSPTAKARINEFYSRFRTESVGRMQIAGAKSLFEENKKFAMSDVSRAIDAGDTESAVRIINQNRGKLFFDEEADGLIQHANQQGDVLKVMQTMQYDPDKAQEMVNDRKATPNIPETLRLRLTDQADTEQRRIDADNWEALAEGISNRTIATPEDAKSIFGDSFAAKYASKIKAAFAANPDLNRIREDYLRINQEVSKLDPKDPEVMKKKFDLLTEIHSSLPEGFRSDALDALNAKVSDKPNSSARSELSNALSTALEGGVFGQWDEKQLKKGSADEVAKKNAAHASMYRIQRDGEEWLRQNPAASPDDLQQWLNQRMSREIKQAQPGWWSRNMPTWLGGAPTVTPEPTSLSNRIDEKLRQHNVSPQPTPAPTPAPSGSKITSYGYNDDPHADSNSAAGVGSFTKHLHEDSFAVSPDVEAEFRARGIKPRDWVELTLSDGTKVRKQWDDRTASDETARKLGLSPLRGRFDFYNPSGVDPLDGVQVRGFQKANA